MSEVPEGVPCKKKSIKTTENTRIHKYLVLKQIHYTEVQKVLWRTQEILKAHKNTQNTRITLKTTTTNANKYAEQVRKIQK